MKKLSFIFLLCATSNLHEAAVNIVLLDIRSQLIEKENWNSWPSQKDKQYKT